jgi:hypothetical protein
MSSIAHIEDLITNRRGSESKEETIFLTDFVATQFLLTRTFRTSFIVLLWNAQDHTSADTIMRRKKLIKTLDVSFHKHYKKLSESFKKIRAEQGLCAHSIPSVQILVELYGKKSEMLQKFLYREKLPKIQEEDEEEKTRI